MSRPHAVRPNLSRRQSFTAICSSGTASSAGPTGPPSQRGDVFQYGSIAAPPPQSKGGGRRQSAVRGAGRQPSPASEPTLNFKRLIRKRRPFPSLRAAKCDGAGISRGLCGGGKEVTVTAPAGGQEGAKACGYTCVHTPVYSHTCIHVTPGAPALTRTRHLDVSPSLFPSPHPPTPSAV